ncbi:biliverdin-producing heme oxygenase [Rhizobium halophytocola]|uniref:Heme oxygenase n=1 Tax=Rhizobium halophytocola TaxID=735519 RepID=A0ABS4DSN2_9HYPH|nr:biliverdin-producing heme oxygenase [Rhizobium halophytocola]MBP1848701.1 heme oxygenase [Rhizobium halophytocola]
MPVSDRRQVLRTRTAPIHRQLDEFVGDFSDLSDYSRYLRGMLAFRRDVEADLAVTPMARHLGDYQPSLIVEELQHDLAATGGATSVPPTPQAEEPRRPLSRDAMLGMLYVLEGSALGARILVKRAERLGLGETTGAAHLKKQSASLGNWNAFCAFLDLADNVDEEAMVEAAVVTFNRALHAFEKA